VDAGLGPWLPPQVPPDIFGPLQRMRILFHIGRYFQLMGEVFGRPERLGVYWRRIIEEIDLLGVKSLGIVAMLSAFMGAVIALQTKSNINSPLISDTLVGFATRQSTILEFSPTIIALILAGKVGSTVAAEIGSMRVKEQIDALDIMGVNSAGYLILPKVIAAVLIFPFLIIMSMFLSVFGGYLIVAATGIISTSAYQTGIRMDFMPFSITYALIKTEVFAFIITTVSGYHGYYTQGGTREVGISSTTAVVYSIVAIIISNFVLTKLLLA